MVVTSKRLALELHRVKAGSVALFLGAGASSLFGYPTTGELLPIIVRAINSDFFLAELRGDPSGKGAQNRQHLAGYLHQLLPGMKHQQTHLPLVTSLLSLLDFSLTNGQVIMTGRAMEETRHARRLLERAILEIIDDARTLAPEEAAWLEAFSEFMRDLQQAVHPGALSLITTNYDMAADRAAFMCAEISRHAKKRWEKRWDIQQIASRIDLGFEWFLPSQDNDAKARRPDAKAKRPDHPIVGLYKLHGSANWLRCPLCDRVYMNPWGPIWKQGYREQGDRVNTCACSPTRLQAQIVSPSFVRDVHEPNLPSIWNNALEALRTAENWLLIGYSFPDEDLGVRAMFTRAYGARTCPPRISVIQHGRDAYQRYSAFFEPSSLQYTSGGLGAFLNAW